MSDTKLDLDATHLDNCILGDDCEVGCVVPTRASLLAQLAEVVRERDEARAKSSTAYLAQQAIRGLTGVDDANASLRAQLAEVTEQRDAFESQLRQECEAHARTLAASAEAAVMREALEDMREKLGPCEPPCKLGTPEKTCPTCRHTESEVWCVNCIAERALATDAGAALLAELAELREKVRGGK